MTQSADILIVGAGPAGLAPHPPARRCRAPSLSRGERDVGGCQVELARHGGQQVGIIP
jgi:hypothetical protein